VEATARLNSALGYGEVVEAAVSRGSRESTSVEVSASQRRLFGGVASADARAGQTARSFQRHSSFSERVRSMACALRRGPHELGYELSWRALSDPSHAASAAVRRQLGHSCKSSLRYAFLADTRDAAAAPRAGWALRAAAELAGLGPASTARFLRAEAEGQWATALPLRGTALALTLRCGALLPWGGGGGRGRPPGETCISDRFFLGGADSLRGFRSRGAGPSAARRPAGPAAAGAAAGPPRTRDALGGDLLFSALAAVTFPLPSEVLNEVGVHGHVWANAGTLLPLAAWQQARASLRLSTGLGLVFPTRIGRMEVNYCVVLRKQEHDELRRGIQFGLRPDAL